MRQRLSPVTSIASNDCGMDVKPAAIGTSIRCPSDYPCRSLWLTACLLGQSFLNRSIVRWRGHQACPLGKKRQRPLENRGSLGVSIPVPVAPTKPLPDGRLALVKPDRIPKPGQRLGIFARLGAGVSQYG